MSRGGAGGEQGGSRGGAGGEQGGSRGGAGGGEKEVRIIRQGTSIACSTGNG